MGNVTLAKQQANVSSVTWQVQLANSMQQLHLGYRV